MYWYWKRSDRFKWRRVFAFLPHYDERLKAYAWLSWVWTRDRLFPLRSPEWSIAERWNPRNPPVNPEFDS